MNILVIPLFIGTTELILIAALALLLFGGKKLPELMKGLGQGMQSFKKGLNDPLPEEKKVKDKNDEHQETTELSSVTHTKNEGEMKA